jgi:hypothetical protein
MLGNPPGGTLSSVRCWHRESECNSAVKLKKRLGQGCYAANILSVRSGPRASGPPDPPGRVLGISLGVDLVSLGDPGPENTDPSDDLSSFLIGAVAETERGLIRE